MKIKNNTNYTSVIVQSFLGRIGLNCCNIPACIAVVFLSQTHQYQRGWLALTILKLKIVWTIFNFRIGITAQNKNRQLGFQRYNKKPLISFH
jgi:hypothetical protein